VSLAATGTGLVIWAVIPVFIAGFAIWQNYFKAMAIHSQLYLSQTKFPAARFSASEVIEGIPLDTLGGVARIPFADTSIYKLISWQLQPSLLLGTWAVLVALSGFLLMRRGETGSLRFWWILSAWIVVGDYLLPVYRYPYNHILLWPMLLLGPAATTGRARSLWQGLSTALLVLHVAVWFLPKACIPWPGTAALGLALGVALLAVKPAASASSRV